MNDSVIDRLRRDRRGHEVLSDLLGVKIPAGFTKAVRCIRPNLHKNGDAHPSMQALPDAIGVKCPCGLSLGLFALIVELGHAPDEPAAAKWAEERWYSSNGHMNGNGHATPAERPWPYYPKTATDLGWEVVDDHGAPALRCPTHDPTGKPGRTKVRRRKGEGPTANFEQDGDFIGLLGVPHALEMTESAEAPTIALLAGETDLLAWTYHAKAEGIAIPGVSSAKGENSALGSDATLFRGAKAIVLYDADDVGREHGPKRAAEILAAGALSAVSVHVPKGKDVCEYLTQGGTVRVLVRLAEPKESPKLSTVTLRDVLDAPVEDPAWFVDGLLGRKRLTILTAAPKTGKSASAFGVAMRLASGIGGNWLGTDFGNSLGLRVIYLSAEGGRRLIQKRYGIIAKDLPGGWESTFNLLLERPWPRFDTPQGLALLRESLRLHPTDLLVIDPLARFRDLEAENDNAATQLFVEGLRAISEEFDLAVLLVHHPSKAAATDREGTSYYGGRGASALFGEVDAAISLRKDAKSGEIHAYFELRDAEPIEPGRRLTLNADTLWLDHLGDLGAKSGAKSLIQSGDVLSAIRGCADEGHPWAQVHTLLGVGKSSWFRERGRVLGELAGKVVITKGVVRAV